MGVPSSGRSKRKELNWFKERHYQAFIAFMFLKGKKLVYKYENPFQKE